MQKSKKQIVGSIKSAFSVKFPFYVFALGLLIAFSAFQCEDVGECEEYPYQCDDYRIERMAEVIVEEVTCGTGAWENLWFNDGSEVYLRPYSLAEGAKENLLNLDIRENSKLRVYYTQAKLDGRYDGIAVCMAYVGESQPIHITAIEILESPK